jgi:hypothetical protein
MNTPASTSFVERLAAARAADEELGIKNPRTFLNGQISVADENMSAWNNYDRYFKFSSITVD